jgi:plastocyanin
MLIAATLFAVAAPGVAQAQNPVLRGAVGPSAEITLRDASGAIVTNLAAGTYDIVVEDRSADHNFHLTGPNVNRATTVVGLETVTWTVTLSDGVYTYVCDPHALDMRGSFTVGTGTSPPPSPPPPPPPPPPPASGGGATKRLVATVGPGATITLTRGGKRVRTLKAGRYTISVRDRSPMHNFHLIGRGINRKTPVDARATRSWTVTFRKGTYRFVCDPHARAMRGTFRVT